MTARARTALALAVILAACTSGEAAIPEPPEAANVPSSSTTSLEGSDGTFEDVAEPRVVRTRFAGRIIGPLSMALRGEMRGQTWEPGCPVPLSRLALLRFNHRGFNGSAQRGSMVVHRSVAEDVLGVFETLFEVRFPIREVALAKRYRPNADPDTRRSVTAAFNCRPVVTPDGPGGAFSQHAYGLAVDVNPLQNPYVRADGFVRNRFARPYVDRSQALLGMIHDGDEVVRAFAEIGWAWGGHWTDGHDYMHFSLTGR